MPDMHPEVTRVLASEWRTVVDDLVGGWAVVVSDRDITYLSETDSVVGGSREVVWACWAEEIARHIADTHNDYLERAAGMRALRGNTPEETTDG